MPVLKMTKNKNKTSDGTDEGGYDYSFNCPGCGCIHSVRDYGGVPTHSIINHLEKIIKDPTEQDLESPTIRPTLMNSGECFCQCEIKDGQINFFKNCDHNLAGKSVPLDQIE